jgi:LysR family glycine cleavage system transcriptional activator
MKRQNLPLSGLRAFEAAARHKSFTAAALELHVTHGAVSQQIKRLEAQTGLELFRRHNRGVQLTEAGAALLPILSGSFDRIGEALETLAQRSGSEALKVTTTPFFASRWLIPRLSSWRQTHGARDVDLHPSLEMLDIASGDCDIGVRCGVPPWPGLKSELLVPIHLSPLCRPALLEGRHGLIRPSDLRHHKLIHADIAGHARGEEWNTWLAAAGEDVPIDAGDLDGDLDGGLGGGLHFHEPALALQAAADGLGIAMGYLEFVQDELASGRLVQPFDLKVRHPFSYYVVTSKRAAAAPELRHFIAWIRDEGASM